ncbi:uncharacterized protein TrAtP1_007125 [Trichoderma atroviride]|uniref:Uncharacterized protein n=1 Tax=Hypocrea atroviridis (strain ATCC 20476 / IMI 206040) TaxID=452589 RepID=G9PC24_HYPAI|nr:uncharacterized protein TRIATDRAFT_160248 [Trichoderma atroviride IMI 206040]EHK39406.1 hypothetical protein TRIATDRAFT_160248 [Trichoderma atroviride IMI 206040]UKZ65936.1 hypothetical protein TrAtP1_007125 [Trichoderma atroviride]
MTICNLSGHLRTSESLIHVKALKDFGCNESPDAIAWCVHAVASLKKAIDKAFGMLFAGTPDAEFINPLAVIPSSIFSL